jgi:hypothetical protein
MVLAADSENDCPKCTQPVLDTGYEMVFFNQYGTGSLYLTQGMKWYLIKYGT